MTAGPTHAMHDATPTTPMPRTTEARRVRAANRRTALVLAAIALVFFFGIIAAKFIGGPATGVGVVGTAVLLFLVVAIGRNLRDKR